MDGEGAPYKNSSVGERAEEKGPSKIDEIVFLKKADCADRGGEYPSVVGSSRVLNEKLLRGINFGGSKCNRCMVPLHSPLQKTAGMRFSIQSGFLRDFSCLGKDSAGPLIARSDADRGFLQLDRKAVPLG